MKGNMESLTALAERVEAVEKSKEDFIVPSNRLSLEDDDHLAIQEIGFWYEIGDVAHNQLAARLKIPRDFYNALPQRVPGARRNLVNELLMGEKPERRMVRTLEGRARAFLSDKFSLNYDNFTMLNTLLPTLQNFPALRVKSCSLTERRMYIQLVFPQLQATIKVGDTVAAGITMVNSEVGEGAWDVLEFLEILRCLNGMVGQSLMRKFHVGRRADDDGVYKRDTIEADIRAVNLQLRDVVASSLDEVRFQKRIAAIKSAAEDVIPDPVATIERVTKRFAFGPGDQAAITGNLIKSGEPTRWGLSNAITALAHDIENRDRQFEVEKIGGDIVELTPSEWAVLSA